MEKSFRDDTVMLQEDDWPVVEFKSDVEVEIVLRVKWRVQRNGKYGDWHDDYIRVD